MEIPLHKIVGRMKRLDLIHRIIVHKALFNKQLHFGQLPMIEYVTEHDKCTQQELAEYMHVSPPSIATSVKRLQRAKLLQKTIDENDQRCNRLTVTEEGKELAQQCRSVFDKFDELMFNGFTDEECGQLCSFFDRMFENLATEDLKDKTFFSLIAEDAELRARENKEGYNRG